ncbi:MAG: hypothetical protein ACRC6U_10600 [Fusobacteriaceae bacterium]
MNLANNMITYKITKSSLNKERLFFLQNYFNEFEFNYIEIEDHFVIQLTPLDYSYCEDMSKGLLDLKINQNDINKFCHITNNVCLCLSENWIPYAWAKVSSKLKIKDNIFNFIHIDDHSDMMSPFIYKNINKYYNLLTNQEIDFFDNISMKNAISTGAITIGSMLTIILYTVNHMNIFHYKKNIFEELLYFKKNTFIDNVLVENAERIQITLQKSETNKNIYFKTSNFENISRECTKNKNPSILHIDMDFFNNRYNGSTDWFENEILNNSNFEEQKLEIDNLCKYLKKININNPIKFIFIGLSPSFYPSEYWQKGIAYLLQNLKKIGLDVQEIIDNLEKNTLKNDIL